MGSSSKEREEEEVEEGAVEVSEQESSVDERVGLVEGESDGPKLVGDRGADKHGVAIRGLLKTENEDSEVNEGFKGELMHCLLRRLEYFDESRCEGIFV